VTEIAQGSRDNDDTHRDGTALKWAYDFKAGSGSDVHAVASGTVVGIQMGLTGSFAGYGNVVTIRTTDGFYVTYAHLTAGSSGLIVGSVVNAGDIIAKSGSSGTPDAHLHIQFGSIATEINTKNGHPETATQIANGSGDVEATAYFPKLVMHFADAATVAGATDTNYYGTLGVDEVTGNSLNNLITGYFDADILRGAGGNDTLRGGPGSDKLTGGSGADHFSYLKPGEGNDKITDFTSGVDHFDFRASSFGSGPLGILDVGHFKAQPIASNAGTGYQFIFDSATSKLWFDSDGNGSAAAALIATIQLGGTVVASDILLI
jgi:Ca2+-binding RTX toxin-like protein